MIPWLTEQTGFPPLSQALSDPDGLLAAGGDLSEQRLIEAYAQGIFPWYSDGDPILWWSPDPRCVLFPDQLHISRSLRKSMRKQNYSVTFDQSFAEVMQACAGPRTGNPGTWITNEMFAAYCHLHQQGWAHSVELWQGNKLAGGLYGIAIGRVFFGESMFSHVSNGSKIAFAWLVEQLKNWGYAVIDCQVRSEHLISLGAQEISRELFAQLLAQQVTQPSLSDWQFALEKDWFECRT
ncbi:MAG: leucyl/phenylalanyl-tRNA--protein transferase [Marinobacterium sp.]|nr:leucyl/phenylalanyl-tRNA--protein transferase [Marinobacterium sp.]